METEEEEVIITRKSSGRRDDRARSTDGRKSTQRAKSSERLEVDVTTETVNDDRKDKTDYNDRRSRVTKSYDGRQTETVRGASGRNPGFKRLVVCCDGTWLDSSRTGTESDNLMNAATSGRYKDVAGRIVPPSNVTRLTRAVKSHSSSGVQQIVYYQAGVASMGTIGNKIVGGVTGEGLAEYVREAYSFIANNYDDGDEIFLIGFSRGAYTARSIGGVIGNLGVLTKAGLASFPAIYQDFAHRHDRSYRSPQPNIPFPNKPSAGDPEYTRELQRRRLTTLHVPIKAIGVFDTVGSLGIPILPGSTFFSKITEFFGDFSEYRFYDTDLDPCIENAFQALALDERRAAFAPTLWSKRDETKTNLIQVWFPGVHSNIGGGFADQEIANITLAWMMSMLSPLIDLNLDYIMIQDRENAKYYEKRGETPRAWSFGEIYDNSSQGIYNLAAKADRTPGDYYRTNPRTNEPTNKPLRNTNEYIHASVRSRWLLRGPGYGDKGYYEPRALKNFRLRTEDNMDNLPSPFYWEDRRLNIIIPEAPLRQIEKRLLKMTPEVNDLILKDKAPGGGGGGGGGGGRSGDEDDRRRQRR